jgi:predicted ATPase/Tfp pilus assembly protein PilF
MSQLSIPATTILCISTTGPVPLIACSRSAVTPSNMTDSPLHTLVMEHDGLLCTAGEYHCAVFSSTDAAVRAACAIRDRLPSEGRPAEVRMALHSGGLGRADDTYFGSLIQQGFALLAAIHAGQIVLSQATRAALGDCLPPDTQIQELGMHRLSDLLAPQYLFQLIRPDQEAPAQPLLTLNRYLTNLPIQPTSFIGHTRTVQQGCEMLTAAEARLLTVVASSGTGKTRFSLEVAVHLLNTFPDGVYFVALAPVNDPNLVVAQIAQTLGVAEVARQPLIVTLIEYLRIRQALLILDNFEQVLAAAKPIAALLAGTEQLRMIVTSHVPLRIPEEQMLHLPPLDLPNPAQIPPLAALAQFDAVRLFIERAQAVSPSFTLAEDNAHDVAAICARLSGLPLALELIAAYMDVYDPATLHSDLGSYTYRGLTLPEVLRWTYKHLSRTTQRVFARLGIFAGGCTHEAAQVICLAPRERNLAIAAELDNLARKNLLFPAVLYGSDARYIMLDCIHDYARECLIIQEEVELMARQHGAYYLDLAERANDEGLRGDQQKAWLALLDGEQHNMRAAFHWAVAHNDGETIFRLTAALGRYWHLRGAFSEGSWRVETAMLHIDKVPPQLRAPVFNIATIIYGEQGKFDLAARAAEQSVALFRQSGDVLGVIKALSNLAVLSHHQGDTAQARSIYQECLDLAREHANLRQQALVLNNLGELALDTGDYQAAQCYLDEALGIMRRVNDPIRTIELTKALGWLALERGERECAGALFTEGLALCRDLGGHSAIPTLLEGCAAVESGWRGARLLGAAEALRAADGRPIPPNEHERYARIVESVRAQTGAAEMRTAWAEGRAMSWAQVLAFALGS